VEFDDEADTWGTLAERAAATFGTPCYLSRWSPVARMAQDQERRFEQIPVRSWLSFKTHPVRQLAAEWLRSGRGVEVVSEAELVAIRALGCPARQLLINGVAKHTWMPRHEIPEARVHIDSMCESDALLPLAAAQGWRVGLRCHVPAEHDARDPRFGGQFGMSTDEFLAAHQRALANGVRVEGVHFHLGQSARSGCAYTQAIRHVVDLCRMASLRPSYIDCGGGIDAGADTERSFDELVAAAMWARHQLPTLTEIWLENGRHLTRGSAALIVRVLDIKLRDECRYVICDGGRTNHALDADHGPHRLLVRPERCGMPVFTTIVGPTCMTDDRLARLNLPQTLSINDLIVWLDAGAYHLPWETRFSHGLCAVVWADADDVLTLARARETPDAWNSLWNLPAL
jgi:diaminopimelate decarboxylase